MKRWIRIVLRVIILAVFSLLLFYLGMAAYYRQHFSFGTVINGKYCTGFTVEEVNRKLLSEKFEQTLTIHYRNGTATIPLEDLSVHMDYTMKLQQKLGLQKPMLWGMGIVFPVRMKIEPDILFDESEVEKRIRSYDFIMEEREQLNVDYAVKVIIETLHQGNFEVSLIGNNCYRQPAFINRDNG